MEQLPRCTNALKGKMSEKGLNTAALCHQYTRMFEMPLRQGCLGTAMHRRYTIRPKHIRSCASMYPRYTVHPEHKKGSKTAFL
jgi:hypothetical protein